MPSPPPPSTALTPGPMLPVAGLVLSVVGLCLPPLLLVSLGLGAYAVLRAGRDPAWAGRKQVAQMSVAVSLAGMLVLTAIIVPGLKRRQLYLKQVECQQALNALYGAQSRLYAKEKRYTARLSELDEQVPPGRFILRLAAEGPLAEVGQGLDEAAFAPLTSAAVDDALPQLLRREVGVRGVCPACSVTMLCATDLDADTTLDVWTVSSVERTGADGSKVPGGVAWCESDDGAR